MSWLKQALGSSIGGKFLVAITGLGMVGFLIAHVAGNLLIFAGPEALAEYAEGLRKFPTLLLLARVGLVVMTFLHVAVAIKLNLGNRAARPIPYQKKNYIRATFSSRTMVLTGLLILFYSLYHLAHFTWRTTDGDISALGPWEVHRMLVIAFQDPLQSGIYIAAMIVLGLHLSHGVSSLFQTLGWKHPKYNRLIHLLGPALGTVLALAYVSIPVSVLLGIVK